MTPDVVPPRVPERVVAALVPEADFRDAVLGDLYEDHAALVVDCGPRAAGRWYWSQVFRSAPRLLSASAARLSARDWLTMAVVVIAAYVSLAAMVMAGDLAIGLLLSPTISPDLIAAISLVCSAVWGVAGGYIAAWMGRRAPLASAIALGGLCTALAGMMLLAGAPGVPRWYSLGLLLVVLPATTTGGFLRTLVANR